MRLTGSLLDALHGLSAQLESAMQWAFFRAIFSFLDDEVDAFRANMLGGIWELVMGLALSLATIWVLWQGYLIMSGRSRESLMGLVVSSLRTVLILTAATTFTFGSTELYRTFTDSLPRQINYVVSGSDDALDESLTTMQAVFVALDALPGVDNTNSKTDKDRAMWMTGIGVAGPAVIGGALLLLYKLALAMFVGFGPLFILALLFDQTKPMFSKWLFYGIGTLFSLAVLVFMVSVAMRMVIAVGAAYAAQVGVAMMTPGGSSTGISTLAMQQGGLGMILTVLLVMTTEKEDIPSLLDPEQKEYRWVAHRVLGEEGAPMPPLRSLGDAFWIPQAFARRLYGILTPGTTVLLSDLPGVRATPAEQGTVPVLESDEAGPTPVVR